MKRVRSTLIGPMPRRRLRRHMVAQAYLLVVLKVVLTVVSTHRTAYE